MAIISASSPFRVSGIFGRSASAALSAATARLTAIQGAIGSLMSGLASVQQIIAALQAELGSLVPPDPAQFQKTERRTEGTPPNQRTVQVQVLDNAAFAAAMSTYTQRLQQLQSQIQAKQAEVAQKQAELAGKQQELASAQQELQRAQQEAQQPAVKDQRALEEERKRIEEQNRRAQEAQRQVLEAQAQAQKAQDDLKRAQEALQRAAQAAQRLSPQPKEEELRVFAQDAEQARSNASLALASAKNHLPQIVNDAVAPPASTLTTRDYVELAPRVAAVQQSVAARESAQLLRLAETNAGRVDAGTADRMRQVWQRAGFSAADIDTAMTQLASHQAAARIAAEDPSLRAAVPRTLNLGAWRSALQGDVTSPNAANSSEPPAAGAKPQSVQQRMWSFVSEMLQSAVAAAAAKLPPSVAPGGLAMRHWGGEEQQFDKVYQYVGDDSPQPSFGGWAWNKPDTNAIAKAGFNWFEIGYPETLEPADYQNMRDQGVRPFTYVNMGEATPEFLIEGVPVIRHNGDWNTDVVDVRDQKWQDWLVERAHYAYERGARGIKWDCAGVEGNYSDPAQKQESLDAMARVLERLREMHPDMKNIVNQGIGLANARPDLVDGLEHEFLMNARDQGGGMTIWANEELDKLKEVHRKYGTPIFIADYVDDPHSATAERWANDIASMGFTPYITNVQWNIQGRGLGIDPDW